MKQIRNTLLFLLIACLANVQAIEEHPEDKGAEEEELKMEEGLDDLTLQIVDSQIRFFIDSSTIIERLSPSKQKAFFELKQSLQTATKILPADIQKLGKTLDKLELSNGVKDYFLYRVCRNSNERAAQVLAPQFIEKSAEHLFPQAVLELPAALIGTERCEQKAQKIASLLRKIPEQQNAEAAPLALARLRLLYPEASLTELTIEEAIKFISENASYVIFSGLSNNDAFLEAGINYILLGKEKKDLDKATVLLDFFVLRTQQDIAPLIKLIYLFQRLNLDQPDFIALCKRQISILAIRNNCQLGSRYLKDHHLDSMKNLDRINKSADIRKEFFDLILEAQEKKMKNKEFNPINFLWGPTEKETEEARP